MSMASVFADAGLRIVLLASAIWMLKLMPIIQAYTTERLNLRGTIIRVS